MNSRAEIVGKVVALPLVRIKDPEREALFETLFYNELEKHPDLQKFGWAEGARADYHIEFRGCLGDQKLNDFVNRCRRTALRRLYGNRNRKERLADAQPA